MHAKVIGYEQVFLPEFLDKLLVCTLKTRLCQFIGKVVHAEKKSGQPKSA